MSNLKLYRVRASYEYDCFVVASDEGEAEMIFEDEKDNGSIEVTGGFVKVTAFTKSEVPTDWCGSIPFGPYRMTDEDRDLTIEQWLARAAKEVTQ